MSDWCKGSGRLKGGQEGRQEAMSISDICGPDVFYSVPRILCCGQYKDRWKDFPAADFHAYAHC